MLKNDALKCNAFLETHTSNSFLALNNMSPRLHFFPCLLHPGITSENGMSFSHCGKVTLRWSELTVIDVRNLLLETSWYGNITSSLGTSQSTADVSNTKNYNTLPMYQYFRWAIQSPIPNISFFDGSCELSLMLYLPFFNTNAI